LGPLEETPDLPPTSVDAASVVESAYWRSRDAREILACVLFAGICVVVSASTDTVVTERPIPFQLLDNTGDYVRNLSFDEPFDGETVSDTLLIVFAIVVPVLLQLVVSRMIGEKGDVHATICVYFVALGLTQMTTDLLKWYCGYLRPIFYTLCEPDDTYESCTSNSSSSMRRSFPSGHASTAFCGLTLLTLFVHTRFGVPQYRKQQLQQQLLLLLQCNANNLAPSTSSAPTTTNAPGRRNILEFPQRFRCVSILSLIPMGVAFFIAASRVVDNKHFPADVVGGSVLGASIANFVHGLWL
jgi:membrane-associated phospholipid phosphatase